MPPLPIRVTIADWIWKRKSQVMYLIVVDDFFDRNQITLTMKEDFADLTFQYAKAYIEEGKMPPADIAPAILNMADEFMAGRQVALRAGDYVAIHNHLRATRKQ